jgi:hypothetical protein
VIDSSFESKKHDLPRISTFGGMQMDFIRQFAKPESSSRANLDSDPKVRDSSRENEKHDLGRIFTLQGTQISFNEHHEKHNSSICVNSDS